MKIIHKRPLLIGKRKVKSKYYRVGNNPAHEFIENTITFEIKENRYIYKYRGEIDKKDYGGINIYDKEVLQVFFDRRNITKRQILKDFLNKFNYKYRIRDNPERIDSSIIIPLDQFIIENN